MTGTGVLSLTDLVISYASGDDVVRPIDGLNLDIPPGQLVVLLGPSGCGKTSLLSSIGGLLTPSGGAIRYNNENVTAFTKQQMSEYRRHTVGIVFQAFNLVASLTVAENVGVPLRADGWKAKRAQVRSLELLAQVGLEDHTQKLPEKLSGGQQQRVAVARALALDPPLILADEPTAHLDYIQVETVVFLLRRLADEGRTVIVSTHDDRLLPLADQVVELVPHRTDNPESLRPVDVTFTKGDVIFKQGEMGDEFYIVDDGEVGLLREHVDGAKTPILFARAGECFGEMSPLVGLPRTATAQAFSDVSATRYTVAAYRATLGDAALSELVKMAARRTAANTERAAQNIRRKTPNSV